MKMFACVAVFAALIVTPVAVFALTLSLKKKS